MIITIDGPVASGKSTLARALARELGYYYINSGLLFRALAHVLLTEKVTLDQLPTISRHELEHKFVHDSLVYTYTNGKEKVSYKKQDITSQLKSAAIDQAASIIATNPVVREQVLVLERALAQNHNIVTDGRDTGSIVFPSAQLKIFLTASDNVRATRWLGEQKNRDKNISHAQALEEIRTRDTRDKNRAHAPLKVPDGGIILDSSGLSIQELVEQVKKLANIK